MRKSRKYSSLAIERPEIAAQWDYENNEMTPDEVTAGSGYKVAWICEKGHRWRAAIGLQESKLTNAQVLSRIPLPSQHCGFAGLLEGVKMMFGVDHLQNEHHGGAK